MLQIFLPPLNTAICEILGPWKFLHVQYLLDLDHLGHPADVMRKWKTSFSELSGLCGGICYMLDILTWVTWGTWWTWVVFIRKKAERM